MLSESDIRIRLQRLERRFRWLVSITVLSALGLCMVSLGSLGSAAGKKTITADEIVMDGGASGRTEITPGSLQILDSQGYITASISSVNGGTVFVAFQGDSKDMPVASIRIQASRIGGARIDMMDAQQGGTITLIQKEGRGLAILTGQDGLSAEGP